MADVSRSLGLNSSSAIPDADTTKPKATKAFMSLHIVSTGAHAVRNTLLNDILDVQSDDPTIQSQMANIHKKVADLQTKLAVAKSTADVWIDSLCSEVSQMIPNHILDYGATYDAASDQILMLLDNAKASPSDPTNKQQALELIGALRDQVTGYRVEMDKAKADLVAYGARIQTDHDNLLGGSDGIQTLMSIDSAEVDSFTADIKKMNDEIDVYNKQISDAEIGVGLSIFVACIGAVVCFVPGGQVAGGAIIATGALGLTASAAVWGVLEAKVKSCQSEIEQDQSTKTALNQQLISLSFLHMTVANTLNQVGDAQVALSDLNVFWSTFEASLGDVINDLNKPNASLSVTLDELWVRAAKNNWKDLSAFAQVLVGVTVTPEFKLAA